MLTVMAIGTMLVVLAIQAVNGLTISRGVTEALDQSAALLELARNEAITRQTYVWVAIKEAEVDGTLETQMAAFYSVDGTTNGVASNIVPLAKAIRIRGTGLVKFSDLRTQTRNLWSPDSLIDPNELLENDAGLTFDVLPQTPFDNNNTITFSPRGEAMLIAQPGMNDGFDPAIAFGIVPARGTIKLTTNDDAAVVLDGSTGTVRTFRL